MLWANIATFHWSANFWRVALSDITIDLNVVLNYLSIFSLLLTLLSFLMTSLCLYCFNCFILVISYIDLIIRLFLALAFLSFFLAFFPAVVFFPSLRLYLITYLNVRITRIINLLISISLHPLLFNCWFIAFILIQSRQWRDRLAWHEFLGFDWFQLSHRFNVNCIHFWNYRNSLSLFYSNGVTFHLVRGKSAWDEHAIRDQ